MLATNFRAPPTASYTAVAQYDPSQDPEFIRHVQRKNTESSEKQQRTETKYAALLSTVIVLTILFGICDVSPSLSELATADGGKNPQRTHLSVAWWLIAVVGYPSGAVALSLIIAIRKMDPGRVKRSGEYGPNARRCEVCGLLRPPERAHHCRVCGYCVEEFDHHCFVLGRCIARNNRVFFIALLFAGAAAFTTAANGCYQMLVAEMSQSPSFRRTVKALTAQIHHRPVGAIATTPGEPFGHGLPGSFSNTLWGAAAAYADPLAMATRGLPCLFYLSASLLLWISGTVQLQTYKRDESSLTVCNHFSREHAHNGEKKSDNPDDCGAAAGNHNHNHNHNRNKHLCLISRILFGCWSYFERFTVAVAAFKRRGRNHRYLVRVVRVVLQCGWCYFLLWVLYSFAHSARRHYGNALSSPDGGGQPQQKVHEFDVFLRESG